MAQLRRPRDRDDERLPRQQPGERDLRGRRLFSLRHPLEQFDEDPVRTQRFGREARKGRRGSHVVLRIEHSRRCHLAGQEPHPERAPRHEADAELLAGWQHLVFRVTRPDRVFVLDGRYRLHGVRTADRRAAGLREPEVTNLAGGDKIRNRARHILDRDVRIDAVLIKEIDSVRPEALETAVRDTLDVVRTTVQSASFLGDRIDLEPELGGDHDIIANRCERLADDRLADERAVDLRGVEEANAAFVCVAHELDRFLVVGRRPIRPRDVHAAKAQPRDLQRPEPTAWQRAPQWCRRAGRTGGRLRHRLLPRRATCEFHENGGRRHERHSPNDVPPAGWLVLHASSVAISGRAD